MAMTDQNTPSTPEQPQQPNPQQPAAPQPAPQQPPASADAAPQQSTNPAAAPQPAASYAAPDPANPYVPQPGAAPQPGQPNPYNTAQPQYGQSSPYAAQPQPQPGTVPQPGAPVPPYYAYPGVPPQPEPSSGKATAAVVCGAVAIVLAWVPFIGLILGIVAIVLAVSAGKQHKSGKTTAAKVCGVIGIVFSIVALVLYALLGMILFKSARYGLYIDDTPSYSRSYDGHDSREYFSGDSGLSTPSADEEHAINEVAIDKLRLITNQDPSLVSAVAADLDDDMRDALAVSFSDVGVDSSDVATWLMGDFSYEIDGTHLNGPNSAVVFVTVQQRNPYSIASAVYDKASELTSSGTSTELGTAEANAALGAVIETAMDDRPADNGNYVVIDLENSTGSWRVTEGSWESCCDLLFDMF